MVTLTDMFCGAGGSSTGAIAVPGIDIRGAGGYVVAPPSTVTTDDYAGTYRWAMGFAEEPCAELAA